MEGSSTSHEKKAKRAGVVLLEKKKLQGVLTAAFQYLKRAFKKRKSVISHRQTVTGGGNGFKIKEEK